MKYKKKYTDSMSINADQDSVFAYVPSLVTFTPLLSLSPARLSTRFIERSRPIESKNIVCVKLRKCRSSRDEALMGLKPIERLLIVAAVGSAVADANKDIQIFQLKKSVEFRDKVLSSMQQQLDGLCEQLNLMNHPEAVEDLANAKNVDCDGFGTDKFKFLDFGCWPCEHHHGVSAGLCGESVKLSIGSEVMQQMMATSCKVQLSEERRMSNLSDWSSSVTTCADIQQVSSLLAEQDSCNLKSQSGKKDLIITELRTLLESSDATTKRRVAELEDIIQRKTMMITKLRKDLMVLEQKAVQLTRLTRPSSASSPSSIQTPLLTDNLLYNMDNITSPSSSDSDSSLVNPSRTMVATSHESASKTSDMSLECKNVLAASSRCLRKANEHNRRIRHSGQSKEMSSKQKSGLVSSRHNTQSASGDFTEVRRPNSNVFKNAEQKQSKSQHAALQKRWL